MSKEVSVVQYTEDMNDFAMMNLNPNVSDVHSLAFIRCVSSTGLESAILRTHPDRYRDLLEDWLDDIVGQEIKQGDKEMGLKLWEFMKPSILVETILKLDMAYLGIDYDSANQRIAKMIEKSNKLELCAVEACIDLLKRGVVFDRDITFGYLT